MNMPCRMCNVHRASWVRLSIWCACVRAYGLLYGHSTEWKSINTYMRAHISLSVWEIDSCRQFSLNWRKHRRGIERIANYLSNEQINNSFFFCQQNSANPNVHMKIHVNFEKSKLIEKPKRFPKSVDTFHAYRNGANFCFVLLFFC